MIQSILISLLLTTFNFAHGNVDSKKRNSFILSGYNLEIPEESMDKVLKKFAPIKKHDIKKIKSTHHGAGNFTDEVHDIHSEGLIISLYKKDEKSEHKPGSTHLSSVTVTSPKIKLMYGLKVGSTRQQVLKELGEPQRKIKSDLHWQYDNSDVAEVDSFLNVYFADNKVTKFVWDMGAH